MASPSLHYLPIGRDPVMGAKIARMRMLLLAEGVLVGLRRCQPSDAFAEVVNIARTASLSPYAVAAALVALTSGQFAADTDDPAILAVQNALGTMLSTRESPSQ